MMIADEQFLKAREEYLKSYSEFMTRLSLKRKLRKAASRRNAKANRKTPWNSVIEEIELPAVALPESGSVRPGTPRGLRPSTTKRVRMRHATKGWREFRRP